MSNRGPAVAIISMAQQASPNVAGHSEPFADVAATFSTVDSSRWAAFPLVPTQASPPPHIGIGHEHHDHEQQHLYQREHAQAVERHRPRVEDTISMSNTMNNIAVR